MEMAAQASLRKVNTQFGRGLLEEQPFLGSCYLRDLTLCIKQFSGLDQSCCFFLFFPFFKKKKKEKMFCWAIVFQFAVHSRPLTQALLP